MSHSVAKSWETYKKSMNYLACGSSTSSKRPQFEDSEPALIARGKGCRVWDLDGNEYIDFRSALGPVTLGYAVDEIDNAVIEQIRNGIIYGQPHPLEGEVARLLTEVIPCAERVRFLKTGGEAIAACIKLARNATKRNKILHCGYNGWLNTLSRPVGSVPQGVAESQPNKGVPPAISNLHISLPWGEVDAWEEMLSRDGNDIAAVVIASDYDKMEQGREFLPAIRTLTEKHGVLMIMDEIVTGFRLAIGGAQEYFSIQPDMAVFGKGMANGMPIAAYVGKADLLDCAAGIMISSTFGGEALSLAAAKAGIGFYKEHSVIEYLWQTGKTLWEQVKELFKKYNIPARMKGVPVCPRLSFDEKEVRDSFFKACYRNGVSLYDVLYVNFSHKEADIRETLERIERALQEMKE